MTIDLVKLRARAHQHDDHCYGRYEPCGEHHMHDNSCGSRPRTCRREETPDLIAAIAEIERLTKERDEYVDALMSGPVAARILNTHVVESHERQEDEIAKLRAHLKTALRDVDDWKRRWNEVSPTGPDFDLALYAGRLTAERDTLKAELAAFKVAAAEHLHLDMQDIINGSNSRAAIERATAEAIAAWLGSVDASDAWVSDKAHGEDQYEAWLADAIRSGAWREKR